MSASGTVKLTGTGTLPSSLGFGSLLQVGNDGAGSLSLAQGAQAGTGTTSGSVEIAATAGASGTMSLTDAGTKLETQLLTVGRNTGGSGGAGMLEISANSEVAVADATVWATGTVMTTGGTLATDPLNVQGGLLGSCVVTGGGVLSVGSGAELILAADAAAGITIAMAGSGATLVLGDLPAVQATVTGFAPGDSLVLDGVTADGGSFAGHTLTLTKGGSNIEPARHPRPQEVWPVRIRENAFAPGVPHRDLRLSPDHAVDWEGSLIPMRFLCNGATIRQEPVAAVVYYHVELEVSG